MLEMLALEMEMLALEMEMLALEMEMLALEMEMPEILAMAGRHLLASVPRMPQGAHRPGIPAEESPRG
jgi:hypothetical protein